ncbi:uncharacterized protein LOC122383054 [Amphibalanus amphitrite]|uniref:uncharacterized protein LOC122383054 n=1 Tax=Amphibalanus amphitrite TaxID=1232801 RepID=UPI001C924E3D|nr:uncharacterized protein LOC122383054 [Amphibalanus amphitrite]
MTVCPLPPRVPLSVAVRACSCAHTLLVEVARSSPAPAALATAALNLLRAVTPLGERLSEEERARWSAVLVTFSGNLGVVNMRAGHDDEGMEALSTFLECAAAAADPSEVKSSSVASKTQLLVDAQRGRQQFEAALRCLARAVPLASDHLPQLLTAWAKVKRDAASRQQTDCMKVTLPQLMADVGSDRPRPGAGDSAPSTARLLHLEVKHYLSVSGDLSEAVRAALVHYGQLQLSPAQRAWMLVTRAQVGLCGAEQAADECAEAVAMLAEKIGQSKKSSLRLNLCMANYYLCINRKKVEIQAAKLSPLTQVSQRPSAPDDEVDLDASCTVVPDYLSINLDREAATLQPLQAVLGLAESLFETKGPESELHPPTDLLTAVTGAAQIYTGLGYQLQAARAWRAVYRAGQQLKDTNACITAASELLQSNLWPEEEDLTPVEVAVSASSDRLVVLRWTLAKAWGHYHLQQVSSALPLLDSVLEDPALLTRSIPYFRVAAEAYRLASLCACVPSSRGTNTLEMAGVAAFHGACVSAWLAADKPTCLAEHLYALGLVFDAVRHVGAVLTWMHCPREVRSYVRDQMEAAYRVAAALRTAEFLSQLIEADLLCEDGEDTQIKLNSLRHIVLDAPSARRQKQPVLLAADTPPAPPTVASSRGRRRRSPAPPAAPAAPEPPPPPPPESGRDLAVSVGSVGSPLGRDARWLQREPRCTSPRLRRARFSAPAPLNHPAGCGCAACACPRRLLLLFSLSLQTARAAVVQDDVDQALEFCAGADECYPLLEEKMRRAAVSCLGQLRPRQLDGLLEPGRVLRCRGRLAHAAICLWFSRARLAQHVNRKALGVLQQSSSRTQLVSRHMYLLTEIWNQKLLIDKVLSEEEDDELATISRGMDQLTTTDSPADEEVSPGRRTPTPAAPPEPPAEPPRRPVKRAGRVRTVPAPVPPPPTPPSPRLVRSTRRRAAAVRSEIQECPPPPPALDDTAATPAKEPAPRATRARRRPR